MNFDLESLERLAGKVLYLSCFESNEDMFERALQDFYCERGRISSEEVTREVSSLDREVAYAKNISR